MTLAVKNHVQRCLGWFILDGVSQVNERVEDRFLLADESDGST